MKTFVIKLTIFIFLILILQKFVLSYFPYQPPQAVESLKTYQQNETNIIFFGDSTTTWWSKYEADNRSIQTMLSNLLNKGIGMVCHDGYQAGMYDAYTNYMVKQNYYPSYIIIPINLRSFSIGWDLGGPQFIDEMLYLDFYNTPLSPFLTFTTNLAIPDGNKLYENIYYLSTEFDGNTVVGSGGDYENKLKNASLNTRFKLMFQMNYLASVNADNSKLNNLLNIADRYRNTKTKVIFYITPIDYQTGEKYFGKRFLTQVKENANTIVSQLKQHQSLVLDLSTSLPSKNFIWKEESYVNEHMNKDGRAFIAAQLAKTIEGNK